MQQSIQQDSDKKSSADTNETEKLQNLLSYGEATELTGLNFWALKYGVKKGRIDTVRVAGRDVLKRESVLEYARDK